MELHQEASRAVGVQSLPISESMVSRHYARHPELAERYGARGRVKCLQDANYHLDYLRESLSVGEPLLFADYLAWAGVMLAARNIPKEDLVVNLECLCEALRQSLEAAQAECAIEYVALGMAHLHNVSVTPPSVLREEGPLSELAKGYLAALLIGERRQAARMVLDAVESGSAVEQLYVHVFQPCQHEVGRLWQMNQISVAQEHYCTAATQLIMSQLYPYLFNGTRTGRTLVATCIAGDLHEIGVRMVSDIFELNGWDTYYLGANTPPAGILQAVRDNRADVLGISATIIPHLKSVEELIGLVRSTPDCSAVKILVGGYPFNVAPEIWRQLGADGYAPDAAASVVLAERLVSSSEKA